MLRIFDSHAHYDHSQFDEDRNSVLDSLKGSGIAYVLNASSDIESSYATVALAEKYDWIYGAAGVHPHEAQNHNESDIDVLRKLSENPKIVAIGEIGLDYYYNLSPKDIQKEWYDKQLNLACELDMPVVIHDRDAHGDIMDILRQYKNRVRGVMHCYSGSREMAEELVDMGFYISFSGSVTFKNARKIVEAAAFVPDDRIMAETDCPYLAPVPHRGERNSSLFLPDTIRTLSAIRGTDEETIAKLTFENACRLFGIK